MRNYLFTSESVSEGHPDKMCDQISDAVLDECLTNDKGSRVACECFATTNTIIVGGEITSKKIPSEERIEELVNDVVKNIGYDSAEKGMDYSTVHIINLMHGQSEDISMGIEGNRKSVILEEYEGEQGAGDQGLMFGYACNETENLMPAPITYANEILKISSKLRRNGSIPWMRPDAKSQVTMEYVNNIPTRIDTIVVSHQHDESVSHSTIYDTIIEEIIKPLFKDSGLIDNNTKYFINPTGRFVKGGPDGDTGLTGRKIIVDTYGGMGRHGGGAFSGKDASKVDRSGAYMARHIAKTIVASRIVPKCEVQIAYAIGIPQPVSVYVNTFNTLDALTENEISRVVKKIFDMSPSGIIDRFGLMNPIYKNTASYGHFSSPTYPWECVDVKSFLDEFSY